MASTEPDRADILTPIKWPLRLTLWGMAAERITRAFWPLWSVLIAALAMLMLGVQDLVAVEWVWAGAAVFAGGALWALWYGVRRLHWPRRAEAVARLDGTMRGNPIQAAMDDQAVGAGDMGSHAVWVAHQARMRARLARARAVEPDLKVSRADPFALRYVALLALLVALVFGSFLRVSSVTAMGPSGPDLAAGPAWEGWMEPPGYTRMPAVYLNDITAPGIDVPEGAQITLRMYGEVGALSVEESVSGRPLENEEQAQETAQEFAVVRSGRLAVEGPGGRAWEIAMTPDAAPSVAREGEIEVSYEGEAQIPFTARDDYGVVAGTARITLALDEVDRRYGLEIAPEERAAIEVPLPMPIAGDRAEFTETLVGNFSEHPWANLPVRLNLTVQDEAGQTGEDAGEVITLPGRRFFDPLAAALIEQRRALLWNRENADDISQILRAVRHRPDDIFRSAVHYLRMRTILARLEDFEAQGMTPEQQDELAQAMWDLALILEEGDLADALERLQRAQDRLTEAMKNGASEEEIAELMQELREATDDYLRQLSRQQQQNPDQNQDMAQSQNSMEMSQNDLQRMMDRIQELMEQGRMAEAQEALEQLRQMMENMQVTQGQGQGQSPGEQAMDGLAETLRDQQGLSDEAFRDLQEQFNPGQQGQNGQQGQQQGQNQGQQGQQGQGREGQQGRDGEGQRQGMGQGSGQQPGQGQQGRGGEQSLEQDLADRQQALRDELNRQQQNLPGAGTEPGEAAREALRRAEEAMEGAEEALRQDDLPGAIDDQSQAMEALREGMRNLGEALAQQGQQQNQGAQGQAQGTNPGQQRDPLGRNAGSNGQLGTDETMLQGEDVYRRARELLDEIRRRSGEGERPEEELEYLERLLERF
ncbi:TIGR02302 family protein [Salipiger mucosus]|uniref:Methyl-accepting chemotaxis protein n=1 Tax=Salipiger mucosus DSM 16094 TaxID=1123237 RepID=S9QT06_9RHOB|nr:TIGR02302 family protein [Salipiger mucosus]EPX82793.1 Methyl-accepting chemotaxis protein [Salipiger mucosus DSM 16094]